MCCSVLHCVLQICDASCVAVLLGLHPHVHSVAVCRSVLWCVAVCCSVLQCVAVYYSMLQCVAVLRGLHPPAREGESLVNIYMYVYI